MQPSGIHLLTLFHHDHDTLLGYMFFSINFEHL